MVKYPRTGTSSRHQVCEPGCPGWDFFETSDAKLMVERCDACNRFDNDQIALAHLAWLIVTALADGKLHTHAVLLLSSGGTPKQWEELGS